jgi:hypothetical protein
MFVYFTFNSSVHSINIRKKLHEHKQLAKLAIFSDYIKINFIKKCQQDITSQYFISCFVNLYMFQTRSVSIIRRSIKLTAYATSGTVTVSAKMTAGRTILLPYQMLHMQSILLISWWWTRNVFETCRDWQSRK